ncbi:hypothetical protein [uncultured Cohaesibacter sp.]|uniref:hypothetical protein n=1 Tax=uncultured Cohaesibacter sp. TaxID=1002546 RepID=UPI002930854A|nr:hypothetical protein [uncultured Cohaesibacter sp.]
MLRTVLLLISVLATSLYPGVVHAVMPPQHYADRSQNSKIKAIAVIVDVQRLHIGKRYTEKKVSFRTDFALTTDTGELFTGTCKSVDTPFQEANVMVGGNIYFYPAEGQRVFVTVSDDGGEITSLTPMTQELEHAVRETPEKLRYGIGNAGVK